MRALIGILVVTTGCVVPLAIPSTRFDGGYTLDHRPTLRVGSHVAGYRLDRDARWDVGAGYTVTAPSNDVTGMRPTTSTSGGYLDAAFLHRVDRSTRVSLGPGVSLQVPSGGSDVAPAVYVRAGVEMFTAGKANVSSSGRCGATTGTWIGQTGFGTYVEVAKPMTQDGFAVTAGLTVRLPAFGGIGIMIPYCK